MDNKILDMIIQEVREEFQIPPYFPDINIANYAKEGEQELLKLVKPIDFEKDLIAKSLLKNYINHAYFKKTNEFMVNYNINIVGWQLSRSDEERN